MGTEYTLAGSLPVELPTRSLSDEVTEGGSLAVGVPCEKVLRAGRGYGLKCMMIRTVDAQAASDLEVHILHAGDMGERSDSDAMLEQIGIYHPGFTYEKHPQSQHR